MKPALQNTSLQSTRLWIQQVDYLKGFAIFAVVAIHTSDKSIGYFHTMDALVIANVIISVFCQFAVPLFVLLSGFVLALRYQHIDSVGKFYRKRLLAILPPYLMFSLIYLMLFALSGNTITLRHAVLAIATASSEGHLWFVALIVQLYLLFPLLIAFYDRLSKKWVPLFLAGALLIQSLWQVMRIVGLDSAPFQGPFPLDRVFASHLFYFVVGIVIGRQFEALQARIRLNARFIWSAAALVVLLTTLTSLTWIRTLTAYGSYFAAPARQFLFSVLLEPVLYLSTSLLLLRVANSLARRKGLFGRILGEYGYNSLGVYLIHYFYIILLVSILNRLNITGNDLIFFPIVFVLTLALSLISARLLCHLPHSELLFGVHLRLRASMETSGD